MKPATPAAPPRSLELERFLPYRLSVLANTMSSAIAAAYAERFALSIPEWRVLAVLARQPDLSAAQLVQRTAMDKVAVSRAVGALTRAGRLERAIEECDRRRSRLRLTDAGRAVYDQVVPWALAYEDSVLRDLAPKARAQLMELLDDLMLRALAAQSRRAQSDPPGDAAQTAGSTPKNTRALRTSRG